MVIEHKIPGGGGLNLNVKEWGNSSGIPILLIHGWSQALLCWSRQYSEKTLQKFRLVAFDLRGHGLSDAPFGEEFYNNGSLWAEDVNCIITQLKLDKPVLVGWSFGGIVMTDYVRLYGDDSISGMNFVGGAIQLNESAMGTLIGPGLLDHFEGATSEEESIRTAAMQKFLKGCFSVPLTQSEFQEALKWNLEVRPDVRLGLTSREIDGQEVVGEIDAPILVTQGTDDKIVLPSMAELIVKNAKQCATSWYEGIGHAPFMEDSDRFNRELREFAVSCREG